MATQPAIKKPNGKPPSLIFKSVLKNNENDVYKSNAKQDFEDAFALNI